MTRAVILGSLLLFVLSPAGAQTRFGVGPQAGLASSIFPDLAGEFYKLGLVGGGHADIVMSRGFALRLGFDYPTFAPDQDKVKDLYVQIGMDRAQILLGRSLTPAEVQFVRDAIKHTSGGRINAPMVTASALLKLPLGKSLSLYLLGGGGMCFFRIIDFNLQSSGIYVEQEPVIKVGETTISTEGENRPLAQAGGGLEIKPSRSVLLFLEGRYTRVFTKDAASPFVPVTLGATFLF